jgi:hypothetical protein
MGKHDDVVVVPLARIEILSQLDREIDAQIVFAVWIPHRRIIDKDLVAIVEINAAAIRITQGENIQTMCSHHCSIN